MDADDLTSKRRPGDKGIFDRKGGELDQVGRDIFTGLIDASSSSSSISASILGLLHNQLVLCDEVPERLLRR